MNMLLYRKVNHYCRPVNYLTCVQSWMKRYDSRLQYAEFLPYDVRYTIILPRRNYKTKLIVKHYHEMGNYVVGTNKTLSALLTRFWIVAAREEIIDWEKECTICKRGKAKSAKQIMAHLPLIQLN